MVRPDFDFFESGIGSPSSWVYWLGSLRLIHAALFVLLIIGYLLVTAGDRLTTYNLVGGLGVAIVVGMTATYVELNASPKNK